MRETRNGFSTMLQLLQLSKALLNLVVYHRLQPNLHFTTAKLASTFLQFLFDFSSHLSHFLVDDLLRDLPTCILSIITFFFC